jgi:hypothetical protein
VFTEFGISVELVQLLVTAGATIENGESVANHLGLLRIT